MKRRILPMIMAVIMILSIIQVPAWAADGDDPMETADSNELTDIGGGEPEARDGNNVAQIGDTGYPTLQAAIDAAEDGQTVTLLTTVTESVTVGESQNITLDLNGQTLTNTDGFHTIENSGTLTIIGSGIVDNVSHARAAVYNNVNATVTISGGTYTRSAENGQTTEDNGGNSYYTLVNRGTMTVDGESVQVNQGKDQVGRYSSLVENGWQNGWNDKGYDNNPKPESAATPTLIISAGTFECGLNTIKNDDFGVLQISGGTFRNSSQNTVLNANTAEITGGDFSGDKVVIYNYGYTTEPNVCTIAISDGTFSGRIVDNRSGHEGVTISGGIFSSDVSNYLSDSVKATEGANGQFVVTPLEESDPDAFAEVGGECYKSLSAAIAAAGDGDTVTLLKNTNEDIVIPEEAELILDLNGKTLTNVSGDTITNNGTLTITGDGTVDNVTHGKAAIQNEPGGMVVLNGGAYTRSEENGNDDADSGGNSYYNIVNHGTMEINDGVSVTQTGHFSSMIENGWYRGSENTGGQNSVLTINGGTFSGGLNTIKNDDYGELTINDGTFTSMSQAAFLNWNIATVNGGTFNAESASSGVILNGYLDDSKDQGELTINGGTFNAGDSNTVITTMGGAKHSGDIEITGGTLSGSIVLTDSQDGAQMTITQDAKVSGNVTNSGKADVAITDGATVSGQVSNGTDGTMSVVNSTVGSVPEGTTAETIVIVNSTVDGELTTNTGDKAIMVGGETYDTLAEAIEKVGNGGTIYILRDIDNATGLSVPEDKNFTIDFGGYTYTLIGPGAGSSGTETNGFQLLKDSTITLKNGTIRIAEGANNIKRIIQNYANLTLEDMHIYAQNQQPDENYALSFNNGNITFKGDTDVITTSDETIAFDVCKFASYPSASVTFDESYTGTVNGRIVYDSTNAGTHTLTIQGNGTFGTIEAASGAGEAAKAGIEVTSGHFAKPVDKDYLAETVKAQLKSASNPDAPYSYYPSVEDAIAAAKPGDTVTAVNTEPDETTYTVTLKFNDGKTDNLTYEVSEGTAIDLPTPSRSGYTFEGWYDGNTRVSDPYNVTKTVTLTAEWDYKDDDHGSSSSGSSSSVRRYDIEADAGRGGDISPDGRVRVRRGENQTFRITADDGWEIADVEVDGESVGAVERYTFENVRTDHTISATFRQTGAQTEEAQLPFLDVAEGAWYYDAVTYCYENGIMDGTSSVSFAPNMLLNRAMAAQVLYNLADGTASTAAGFPDVAASAWYADAVNWAAANGYVTGYDNGNYGPEDSLTREQLAVILYRYAGSPEPTGSLDGFTDAASASDYAVDALRWAVGEGLLTGKDGGRLDPAGTASRAELAQILARFAQM